MSHFVKHENSKFTLDLHLERDSIGGCLFPLICPICGKQTLWVLYPIYGSAMFEVAPDGHRGKRTDDLEIDFSDPPNILCNNDDCDFDWSLDLSSTYTGTIIEVTPEPEKNNETAT